jgi:hypothetical protein
MIWQGIMIGNALQPQTINLEIRYASDIQTTQPSKKLSHQHLGPFEVVKKVGSGAYCLKLPQSMSHLHPVFNVIKLTSALPDPIAGCVPKPLPPLKIIDREEEWVVEEILDSKEINWKLQYLVKWEGFGIKHNSGMTFMPLT